MKERSASVPSATEWPTVLLILLTYLVWGAATAFAEGISPWLAYPAIILTIAFHGSLTHEACHGHPTRWQWANDLMMAPALGLFVPHDRYRATHLAHHRDPILTDPYDDPESNFLDPAVWSRLPAWLRMVLRLNNTLLGRIVVGPIISTTAFYRAEVLALASGDRGVAHGWLKHAPAVGLVVLWLESTGQVGWPAYLACAYAALGLQKIRSYLEHRAHLQPRGRTVIVERGGLLGLLFLNNHLHAVHHAHPQFAWYELPRAYRTRRAAFHARNKGYVYASYGEIFRRYLMRAKDPVPHPLWPGGETVAKAAPGPDPASLPIEEGVGAAG